MAYAAKDITVLKGLEPVRQRPGMYIGSTGPTGLHHLVYEIVDNSVDEAMAGYCTRIDVTLLADGGCRVADDGRGMPVDNHPEYKGKSAAEVIMTVLHAGGKFGGEGYKISGGLHGVGASVVNALSSRLDVEIHRDGGKWVQHFAKGGKPQDKLTKVGSSKKHGTTITFWPDETIFEETDFRAQTLIERLREMAFLNKGLEIRFRDERVEPVLGPGVQVQRRHQRLREAPQRLEGAAVQAGDRLHRERRRLRGRRRDAVEHRVLRGHPLVRQQHRHHRGRHARGGLQEGPHQRGEPLRQGQELPQGERPEPPR